MSGNWGYLIEGPFDWQCVNIHLYAAEVVKKIMWQHLTMLAPNHKGIAHIAVDCV
jgi:hypothetical protein